MEAIVELGATGIDHITEKHFDTIHNTVTGRRSAKQSENYPPSSTSTTSRPQKSGDTSRSVPVAAATAPSVAESRRRQRNQLPSPERDTIDRRSAATYTAAPVRRPAVRAYDDDDEETASEISDRITRKRYEREIDDPVRAPESVLSRRQLRRDSAMASRYGDDYTQAPYRSRSTAAPKSRIYDDDDDSDYDERTGRRYGRGNGRGYDDRDDYETVREETERYRGPVSAGPLVAVNRPYDPVRKESFRSGYGDGAMTHYGGGRGRDEDDRRTYISRRSKSRGRSERDRGDYSRSRSRSRSAGSHEGIKEKLGEHFDTSARGLGVGLAGAVIGGLAGRQFGQKHKERDIILGAVIGGLASNAAENKFREWKDKKEDRFDRDEDRWEQKWEGRSRSNVR